MQDLNAITLLGAATAFARLHQVLLSLTSSHEKLLPESADVILPSVINFRDEAMKVGAKLSIFSANRIINKLEQNPCPMTVGDAVQALRDIESRFADHLQDVKIFALSDQESIFLHPADNLIEIDGFSLKFPSSSFEIEEAAKCLAYGRYTATVFHAMRMLELGIRAISKYLSIPDPTRPSEKNWGIILKLINDRIDELWPKSGRLPNSQGAKLEALCVTLDAIRNPWRNSTMHVETIYAPHEAIHILRCSAFFMSTLFKICDEQGNAANDAQESLQL